MSRRALLVCGAALALLAIRRFDRRRLTLARWWIRQRLLRRLLVERDLVDAAEITRVAGVDISFVKESETDACAALVVCELPSLRVVYERFERVVLREPYVPGYLAFREVDFLLALLDELRRTQPELLPHAILVDGNGVLHPNGFGLACHLGVLADLPTIGVGKTVHHVDGISRDVVRAESEARCAARGDAVDLVGASGRVWGAALRTTDVQPFKPILVSVGHGFSLPTAVDLVRRCSTSRIPEPVRQADLRSREWLRTHGTVDS